MDSGAPSAGDHQYKEIQVKIWPSSSTARYAVSVRARRGADLVWDRRLCVEGLPASVAGAVSTSAGVMRATAAALIAAADRLDNL